MKRIMLISLAIVVVIAGILAVAIAMLLPLPGNRSEAHTSSIPTMAVGRG